MPKASLLHLKKIQNGRTVKIVDYIKPFSQIKTIPFAVPFTPAIGKCPTRSIGPIRVTHIVKEASIGD